MKSVALLRAVVLIPLLSFIFSYETSKAMESSGKGETTPPKPKRYFYPQEQQDKSKITDATTAGSGEEGAFRDSSTNSADSAEDSSSGVSATEDIYTQATKIKRSKSVSGAFNRVKSGGRAIKEKIVPDRDNVKANVRKKISRTFSKKNEDKNKKDTPKEERPDPEKKVILVEPLKFAVIDRNDSVPKILKMPELVSGKIQRQRSWGNNTQNVTRATQDPLDNEKKSAQQQGPRPRVLSVSHDNISLLDEKTAMLSQGNSQQRRALQRRKSAHNLNERGENISRKEQQSWKRRSHERPLERSPSKAFQGLNLESQEQGLSPRYRLNPQLSPRLYQRKNPLQQGLLLYLDKSGQPLETQPVSPRYQPTTPRLSYSAKKEIPTNVTEFSDSEAPSEEYLEGSQENEKRSILSFNQEYSPFALGYEKDRGDALFIRIIDHRLFRPAPLVVIGSGIFWSLIFATLPPTAMTGVNVNVTGYYFDIPPGEWLSTTLVTTFMTTFTLALLEEGYEWGQTIGWPIWNAMKACHSCCTGTKEQEDALSTPLFGGAEYTWEIGYKKSLLYYGKNLFSLTAALSEGILPFALLSSVWAKDFSHLIIPFGSCVLVRYTGQAYNANTKLLRYHLQDYLNQEPKGKFVYMDDGLKDEEVESYFYKENLDPEKATKHKNAVRKAIQQSLREVGENEDIAKEKYGIVKNERDKIRGLSLDEKEYFALSVLMSQSIPNEPSGIANMQEIEFCPMTVNCLKLLYQKGISLTQKPADFIRIPLKALALVGAGMAIEQGLRIVFQYWLPHSSWTPKLINISSGTLIVCYATKELLYIAKAVKEYNASKASLASVSNFSLASIGATVPAGFSALVGVALGFQYVDESESSQKWKALMIAYGLDALLSGHTYYKNKLQGFQTNAVTTIPEYTKECVVAYTPQFIMKGANYLKEGIVNNTPGCLKDGLSSSYNFLLKYTSPFYHRSWLWKWHHDLDKKVNDDNDSVTNATLYFTQQGQSTDMGSDDELSGYGKNVEYYIM
ncbi:MAG: hypothetical protein ACOH2E_03590 [Candidatus Paracaedibacter sp.]